MFIGWVDPSRVEKAFAQSPRALRSQSWSRGCCAIAHTRTNPSRHTSPSSLARQRWTPSLLAARPDSRQPPHPFSPFLLLPPSRWRGRARPRPPPVLPPPRSQEASPRREEAAEGGAQSGIAGQRRRRGADACQGGGSARLRGWKGIGVTITTWGFKCLLLWNTNIRAF
ncbi:hypothetical protein ACQJBY_027512 [Aegilops geniculata]